MSEQIFKIYGNFKQGGEWATPDPSFVGEIVVLGGGSFVGYCMELYHSETPTINQIRFLLGTYNEDGICFYKLSNHIDQLPLIYAKREGDQIGAWGSLNIFLEKFEKEGDATISLIEQPYSSEDRARILALYHQLDRENDYNSQILKQLNTCSVILSELGKCYNFSSVCLDDNNADSDTTLFDMLYDLEDDDDEIDLSDLFDDDYEDYEYEDEDDDEKDDEPAE